MKIHCPASSNTYKSGGSDRVENYDYDVCLGGNVGCACLSQ